MCRRLLLISCVLFAALTLTGCFGLIAMGPQDCVRSGDSISMAGANETPSTKEEVKEFWGKPDEVITVSESKEAWIYNKKDLWRGLIPVVFLPVPLILPVGNGFDRIEFRGNEATSLLSKKQYGVGAAGLFPPLVGEIGQKDFPYQK